MGGLALEIAVPDGPLRRSQPAPIRVTLRNAGSETVVVNGRLAPGYVDSISRELYFDVTGPAGEDVRYGKRKYDRDISPPSDYSSLGPGQAITAEVDLLAWYRLPEPGRYHLTGHYQADEPIAEPPPDVVRGVVSSPTYDLDVE